MLSRLPPTTVAHLTMVNDQSGTAQGFKLEHGQYFSGPTKLITHMAVLQFFMLGSFRNSRADPGCHAGNTFLFSSRLNTYFNIVAHIIKGFQQSFG